MVIELAHILIFLVKNHAEGASGKVQSVFLKKQNPDPFFSKNGPPYGQNLSNCDISLQAETQEKAPKQKRCGVEIADFMNF